LHAEHISKTMNKEVLFTEKQRFTQWWIWAIILIACIIPAWEIYNAVINYRNGFSNPASYIGLVTIVLLMIMLISTRLETEIRKDGINVRFIPFIWRRKIYTWDLIEKVYLREYNPIGEFGGWGIRGVGKNRALNISGNKGLQLELKDGKRMLIGTHKPDEIKKMLELLGRNEAI
jgi:hypothetical protein